MGNIFRRAASVLAWLGTAPKTAEFCKSVREHPTKYLSWNEYEANEPTANPAVWRAEIERDVKEQGLVLASPEYWKRADERYAYIHDLFKKTSIDTDIVVAFERLDYWTRAWITQELILASRVTFVAGDEDLDFAVIEERIRVFESVHGLARSKYRGEGLAQLLLRFGKKKCWMKRDRVFSLLGVCPEVLEVDYKSQDVDVFVETLNALGSQACLCTAAIVAESMELDESAVAADVVTPKIELSLHQVNLEECWGRPDCEFLSGACRRIS
jgi:hypothetical protein